jgi:hypothetical protein
MAVLGPTVVGLFAYFSGNQGAGDATFLPETFISKKFKKGVYYKSYSTIDNAVHHRQTIRLKGLFFRRNIGAT